VYTRRVPVASRGADWVGGGGGSVVGAGGAR
jgi:hypothetical protein